MAGDYAALYLESRFDEALAVILERLDHPLPAEELVGLLAGLGELRAQRREWPEACQAMAAAVNRATGVALGDYLRRLALFLFNAGNFEQTLEVCGIIGGTAGPPSIHCDNCVLQARALARLGRWPDSRAKAGEALAHQPDSALARLWVGLTAAPAGGHRIVGRLVRPEECDRLLADVEWTEPAWPPSDYAARLYPFQHGTDYEDATFVVTSQAGAPLVRCDVTLSGQGMSAFGGPVRIRAAAGAPDPGATQAAVDHLIALAAAYDSPCMLAEPALDSRVSAVGAACLRRGLRADTLVLMDVDLTRPEADAWRAVRKSYRPLIRAGERRFTTRLYRSPGDEALFEVYRQLHYRHFPEPKADYSFLAVPAMKDMAARGELELAVTCEGDAPVAANITIDCQGVSTYYSARYSRAAGIDAGPFALWSAVDRARRRGQRSFHLGYYDFEECRSSKMRSIAFFKSGFTDQMQYRTIWRIPGAV